MAESKLFGLSGVIQLTGYPVALPVSVLLAGMDAFRAYLYAAFLSGRTKDRRTGLQTNHTVPTANPIARQTLVELSGVGAGL